MSTIKNYLSLVKFSHTIFALPFAMIGFFLAAVRNPLNVITGQSDLNNSISWGWDFTNFISWRTISIKFILILICMVTARSAAMAFNRYLDRHFDAKNPRTAIREIPKGIISADSALRFTIACCVLFVITTYLINPVCFFLSPVALFIILF